jgi:neutral ceramidase
MLRFSPTARLFFAACLLLCRAPVEAHSSEWKAAAAKVVITPQKNIWMAGYAARKGPAEGKLQDLFAKTLVVEDESGTRFVWVTMDLIGVPKVLRAAVASRVEEAYKLPPTHLLMNASHTHCGPMIRTYQPRGGGAERIAYLSIPSEQHAQRLEETQQYRDFLTREIVQMIGRAIDSLQPVQIKHSQARCGFAMNRRLPSNGSFANRPNPEGPVDHAVPVLQIRSTDDKLLAVLFSYACHNTTLGVMQFNGDYAGFAQQYLEEDHPGTVALFASGCGGDQNPYPRRLVPYAERHGRALAMAVEAALEANPQTVSGTITAKLEDATLDYARTPTKAELTRTSQSTDAYDARQAQLLLEDLETVGHLPKTYPCPVQYVSLGDVSMIAIGGEVVVDYAIRLKREVQRKNLWVLGYSNDVFAYTPSRRVVLEGGYEGATSMRYVRENLHPSPWAPTIEDRIVAKVHELVGH